MRWQYCWSWASGKHQLLKAFLPLSLDNFFFRENVSAPYLYLSNFAIPSNTEWIPVLPWLGLSRCPKIGCTNAFLAFKSLSKMQIRCHKHTESLGSVAEVLPSGCSLCGGMPLPSLLSWHGRGMCWRAQLSPLASWGAKAKISWIWVETALRWRARRTRSALQGLEGKSAQMLSEFKVAQGGGEESAVRKPLQGTGFTDSPGFGGRLVGC